MDKKYNHDQFRGDIYKLNLYKRIENEEYKKIINEVIFKACHILPRIRECFPNYTEHGLQHSYMVVYHMQSLINKVQLLSEWECCLIILAGLLHDIGMVYEQSETDEIKKCFLTSYNVHNVNFEIMEKTMGTEYTLKYFVRELHGERALSNMRKYGISDLCSLPESCHNFSPELAFICNSHTMSFEEIKKNISSKWNPDVYQQLSAGKEQHINIFYICILLRVADLLDFDADRAPRKLFNELGIEGNEESNEHWKKNELVRNRDKIRSHFIKYVCVCNKQNEVATSKTIVFEANDFNINEIDGKAKYLKILRWVLKYIDYVNPQLQESVNEAKKLQPNEMGAYSLDIIPVVEFIKGDKKGFPNARISFDFDTIVNMLLTEKIYGDKRVGLREIIQNSIDACKYRNIMWNNPFKYSPEINILFNYKEKKIIVTDNGCGMDIQTIKECFLRIGGSIYKTDRYRYSAFKFPHAGYYGIGFFAVFMLSNKEIEIQTSHMNDVFREKTVIKLDSRNEYLSLYGEPLTSGENTGFTQIALDLDDVFSCFCINDNDEQIEPEQIIKSYIMRNFLLNINDQININFTFKKISNNGELVYEEIIKGSTIDTNTNEKIIDLTNSLDGVQCKIAVDKNVPNKARWFSYDDDQSIFREIDSYSELSNYKQIYYLLMQSNKNEYIYLIVPDEYESESTKQDAFGYHLHDSQRLISSLKEPLYISKTQNPHKSISLEDFCKYHGIEFTDTNNDDFTGFVCKRGVYYTFNTGNNLLILNKNRAFDDNRISKYAIKSGRRRYDKIHIRNIRIDEVYITLPFVIIAKNMVIVEEIKDIIINIIKEGVIPDISRKHLNNEVIYSLEFSIGRVLMEYYCKSLELGKDETDLVVNHYYEYLENDKVKKYFIKTEVENEDTRNMR